MKHLKLLLLGMMLASGTLFAMEEGESTTPTSTTAQAGLLAGIEANNPEQVRIALESDTDPNEFDTKNEGPLAKAIDNFYKTKGTDESLQIVHSLLQAGANLNCVKIGSYINSSMMVEYPALLAAIVRHEMGWAINQNIYPLIKLLYDFEANPHEKILDTTTQKIRKSNLFWHVEQQVFQALKYQDTLEYKKDWAKIGLLLFPKLIELQKYQEHQPVHEYLQEMEKEVRLDILSPTLKKPGSVFNYLKHRELGIRIPKKSEKVVNKGKQETNSNDSNSQ